MTHQPPAPSNSMTKVLERIFQYAAFDTKEYANYRLVSKEWWEASLKLWRENACLTVQQEESQYTGGIDANSFLKQLKFPKNDFLQLGEKPFKKYCIAGWSIRLQRKSNTKCLEFWEKVGPLITHLTIDEAFIFNAEDFRTLFFELTPNLQSLTLVGNRFFSNRPKLQSVRLDPRRPEHLIPKTVQANLSEFTFIPTGVREHSCFAIKEDNALPISWMELFVHFPKIKGLTLARLYPSTEIRAEDELLEIFQSMEVIQREHGLEYFPGLRKLNFEELDHPPVEIWSPNVTVRLQQLHFSLTTFSFDVGFATDEAAFGELLRIHSETVEDLTIFRGRFVPPFQRFPVGIELPKLTSLTLKGPIFPNLEYLLKFPNLESLHFQHGRSAESITECTGASDELDCNLWQEIDEAIDLEPPYQVIDNTNFANMNGLVLAKLKKFTVDSEICTGAEVEALGRMMPNLRYLRIGLANDGFSKVCQTWPDLEQLEIHPFNVTEKGMLGIAAGQIYSKPNITDLKHLKSFSIGYSPEDDFDGLTPRAVFDGIFCIASLNKINVFLSRTVNQKDFNLIRARFPSFPTVRNQLWRLCDDDEDSDDDDDDDDDEAN